MELRVTTIQSLLHWENRKANLDMFDVKIDGIENTDLIVLPEMFSTGFTMQASLFADTMNGETLDWMKYQAKKKNAAICGSAIIKNDDGKYVNRFLFVTPQAEIHYYDKAHLFRMGDENNHYIKGNERIIIHYKGFKIAPMVCYDLRFAVWMRRTESFNYDLLLFVANWPERRIEHWKTLLAARAIENQTYVVGVNRIGNDGNGMAHCGDTCVISPLGELLYKMNNHEDIYTTVLNKNAVTDYRNTFPVEKDADEFSLL